jgi:hypothetical protein
MKFSEFNEGSQLETESISLSQEEILEFAKNTILSGFILTQRRQRMALMED